MPNKLRALYYLITSYINSLRVLPKTGQGHTQAVFLRDGIFHHSEGVRKWLVERFDVCMESAAKFTDIRTP